MTASRSFEKNKIPESGAKGIEQKRDISSERTEAQKTDLLLVKRWQEGDLTSFESLVKKYQRRVHAVACGMLHDSEDARDLTQEVFVKAHRYIGYFKGTSSFYTWLYRITVNLCIDFLRKSARSPSLSYDDGLEREEGLPGQELLPSTTENDPARNLNRKKLLEEIHKGLLTLSEKHRAVILLREVQGLSYQEMAEVMRCSKGTIMSRLFHARRRLLAYLREYFGDEVLSI